MPFIHRSWLRPIIAISICLCLIFLAGYEALNLSTWYFVRSVMRNSPQLRNIPKQLPDTHIAVLSGSTWQRFGCTAQLPWTNVEKDRDGRMVAVRSLADKTWVMFSAPEFQPDTAKIYRESAERDPNGKKVVQLIGAENLASKFNFMRAAAYTRP